MPLSSRGTTGAEQQGSHERESCVSPIHQLVVRLSEAETAIEVVGVLGVQQPLPAGKRPALDHLANELGAEPPAATFLEHIDVREVEERWRTACRAAEADLSPVAVEADH